MIGSQDVKRDIPSIVLEEVTNNRNENVVKGIWNFEFSGQWLIEPSIKPEVDGVTIVNQPVRVFLDNDKIVLNVAPDGRLNVVFNDYIIPSANINKD